MRPTVVLVVGSPCAGKTTVCEKAAAKFFHVPHDAYDEQVYPSALAASVSGIPVLGEIPFGLSKIQGALEARGIRVIPVFIYEQEPILRDRYRRRENREIPPGHLKRQETYRERARTLGAFLGTADQVLEHLLNLEL